MKLPTFLAIVLWPFCMCNMTHKPIVGIEMSTQGMHRDLVYTVQFDYPLAGKDCEYILEQQLPPAVYISVDQLDDLKRLRKLNSLYPKFVDIEVPTEKAEQFTILLLGMPKITDQIKLPIHFRYHAPSATERFAKVEITSPKMYMRCPDTDAHLIDAELLASQEVAYCLEEGSDTLLAYKAGERDAAAEECSWRLLNVDYQAQTTLLAKIPVGDKKSYHLVLYTTIAISWGISLWIVYTTSIVPRRINQKLEEQRLIQRKVK